MLGAVLTVEGYGVMGGSNNAKLGENRSFRKMVVVDKKGEDAEGMERRGVGGATVFPWTSISTRGTFYDEYTSSYILR